LEAELAGLRAELELRQHNREKLIVHIQDKLMRIYDRVRTKNKVAVVAVQKEACGGCFERLPPQRINEIRRNENLIFCENCGSILVWDEEGVLNNHQYGKNRRERPE
jgi:predicted  nucleic acid-binding Zn-ribbon protein